MAREEIDMLYLLTGIKSLCLFTGSLVFMSSVALAQQTDGENRRGIECRAACEAAFNRAMIVCMRKPTPRQREACTREAMEVLAACMARCPDGERDCPDGERPLDDGDEDTMASGWMTSSPNES
jgi:hypothetical protein